MSSLNYPVFGTIFGRHGGAVFSSGLTLDERNADNSVERQKHTDTGLASGVLVTTFTRAEGIHTSVSRVVATGSLGPKVTLTEQKVFFLDSDRGLATGFSDWTIFSSTGAEVGAGTGTTDTDVTPSGQQ